MGAKYALYENPNPKGDGKKQPLHARIVPRGTIHTQEIAEEIADSCGYSTATTKGMLDALAKVISKNLRYGYTVELDDLGSFSISLKSRPRKAWWRSTSPHWSCRRPHTGLQCRSGGWWNPWQP